MELKYEYRVTWRRVGATPKRAIYQTEEGVLRCAKRQTSASEEIDWLPLGQRVSPLEGEPVIQRREVGPWN